MPQTDYEYGIEFIKEDGSLIGRRQIEEDWVPAVECTHFEGVRAGGLPPVVFTGHSVIQPVWHEEDREPYVAGFGCRVFASNGETFSTGFAVTYFRAFARRVSAGLVAQGLLKAGESFRYRVFAFPRQEVPTSGTPLPPRFSVREVSQPLPLRESSLEELRFASTPFGEVNNEMMPVLIPRHVLDQVSELTSQSGAEETGGILIGHLCRDMHNNEIASVVTAQITARHTHRDLTKLTFTNLTWTDVQDAINLRDDGEIYLGWWHCHCYMKETCKDCSGLADGTCKANAAFMSGDDCALHRTVFPWAYTVALVVSDSPCSGLTWELFGWKDGIIFPRGFHILETWPADAPDEVACTARGGNDAARS